MKLKLLSPNLNIILEEVLKNQNICKLLKYNINPYGQPDITDTSTLLFDKVYPFPFDPDISNEQTSQLRVYYGRIDLVNAQVVEMTTVHFDIICHKSKSVYLVEGEGETRPYSIACEIANHFTDRSIDTVGKLIIRRLYPFPVNSHYEGVRVVAEMMTIGR